MTQPATPRPSVASYTVGPPIGHGGLAVVYRGTHDVTRRDVALKVLNSAPIDDAARRRFDSEIQAMATLDRHRNIARIVDVTVTGDGRPVIVMDYYRRGSLADLLMKGTLKPREVLQIGVQLCAALESAHMYGVWHRDVKPANILVGDEGEPKLNDFGIAAVASAGSAGVPAGWSPAFVPPEVLQAAATGAPIDETQWDTYSLTTTLYALLTRRTPYEVPGGPNAGTDITGRVRSGTPALLTPEIAPGAPTALLELLNRGIAREVTRRPGRPSELFLGLRAIEQSMGVPITEYLPFRQDSVLPGSGTTTDVSGAPGPIAAPGAVPPQPSVPPPSGVAAGVYIERPAVADVGGLGPTSTELSTRTGGAVKAPRAPAAPAAPVEAPPKPAMPGNRRRLLAIGIGVIVVLSLAGWLSSLLLTGGTPSATPSNRPSPAPTTPVAQTVVRPQVLPTIDATQQADGIHFSWTYPDPADGDRFRVIRSDLVNPTPTTLTEPNIVINDPDPCIEVQIIRANGQIGPAQRGCFP